MKTISATNHRVEIHQSDIADWFSKNNKDIDPSTIQLGEDILGNTLLICIPVSKEYLDKFLRKTIKNLPKAGEYRYEILPHSKEVVGIITWTK